MPISFFLLKCLVEDPLAEKENYKEREGLL
jgi:hypothetical protein